MPRMQWKTRKILSLTAIILTTYLVVRIKEYHHTASIELEKVKPIDVWEYVADFSNMKYLNPTM